jgi:predicted TIM-barrel fold metal-dependent hydrolase
MRPADPIDVHHHAYPPALTAALRDLGVTELAPGVPLPDWKPDDSLRLLDRAGLAAAVLSAPLPDAAFARRSGPLVRAVNEGTAGLAEDRPGRFGALACLPLDDPDGTLLEIGFALDVLGMDGVVLPASLPDGRTLADVSLVPVFDELDRRGAVALVHPNPSVACRCAGPSVPPPLVDFALDTTRAVAGLVFGGTLRRCPHVRLIVAHAGGAVPYLARRFALAGTWVLAGDVHAAPDAVDAALHGLYYDTAQSASPGVIECLREVTDDSHILTGTDFPFMTDEVIVTAGFRSPGPDGAARLFPRLAR